MLSRHSLGHLVRVCMRDQASTERWHPPEEQPFHTTRPRARNSVRIRCRLGSNTQGCTVQQSSLGQHFGGRARMLSRHSVGHLVHVHTHKQASTERWHPPEEQPSQNTRPRARSSVRIRCRLGSNTQGCTVHKSPLGQHFGGESIQVLIFKKL